MLAKKNNNCRLVLCCQLKIRWIQFWKLCRTWLVADVSHIIGLIVGGVHPSPVPYVHDGPMRYFLWDKVFKIKYYSESGYFGFYLLLVAGIIFLVGFGVNLIWKFFERMILDKFFDNIRIQKLMKKIEFYE